MNKVLYYQAPIKFRKPGPVTTCARKQVRKYGESLQCNFKLLFYLLPPTQIAVMKSIFVTLLIIVSTICNGQEYKTGSKVEANWNGAWYSATIIEVKGSSYKIHYDGYGAEWDEWVQSPKLRPSKEEAAPKAAAGFSIGEKVEVWNVTWYPATVLETKGGSYKIRYYDWVGYPEEWVNNDRIKQFGSYKPTPTGAPTAGTDKPQMNGGIPKIVGTSWAMVSIYKKGTAPTLSKPTNYIFCNSGHWESLLNHVANRGSYTVKGTQLIITGTGNSTSTYKITWNAADNYLELDDGESIFRLQYNGKTTC
jgi:hypothetical protein